MLTSAHLDEIKRRLDQISDDAKALAGLPSAEHWIMLAIQVNGCKMRLDSERINELLGNGDINVIINQPSGCRSIATATAATIRSELHVLIDWAREMECGPSFPDPYSKRNAVLKCQQMPSRCEYIWKLLSRITSR